MLERTPSPSANSQLLQSQTRPKAQPKPQLDSLISGFDRALRTIAAVHQSRRPNPSAQLPETIIADNERKHVAALMRINHSGEVAAQALYHGQAATAHNPSVRASMLAAAADETDHLAWCAERIDELGGRKSILNPLWYAGSFAIGALVGLAGDKTSLSFVAETERQVEQHLASHLQQLPVNDQRTRAIVTQMSSDEIQHGALATAAGGVPLPAPIRFAMRFTAQVMTRSAFWL